MRTAATPFAAAAVSLAGAGRALAGDAPGADNGSLAAAVEIASALGDPFSVALQWLRGPILALMLGAGLGAVWSRRAPGSAEALGAALLLAVLAQSWLLDGWLAVGLGVYTLAAACALAHRESDPESEAPKPPRWLEVLAVALLLLLFLAITLDDLDWLPRLHIDEWAYHRAALMESGAIPEDVVIKQFGEPLYSLDRFRAQPIPLALQSWILQALGPGIWGLRLGSIGSMLLALGAGYAATRRILGPLAALAALALCACAPLSIAYARPAHYIAFSVAHGALCLLLLVRWHERPDRGRGIWLGVALGCGLAFYQLSWLVPAVAAGAALALRPWRELSARALPVTLAAALTALGCGFAARDGLAAVWSQTVDKSPWEAAARSDGDVQARALFLAPVDLPNEDLVAYADEAAHPYLFVNVLRVPGEFAGVQLTGAPEMVAAQAPLLAELGWPRDDSLFEFPSPLLRVPHMLARLFYRHGPEYSGEWVAAPLLAPTMAPLVFVGLLRLLRRRDPLSRALGVWVVIAALLPALVGAPLPRRAVLALPALGAVAAWPLIELARFGARRGGLAAGTAVAATSLWLAAAAVGGIASYATDWNRRIQGASPSHSILLLDRWLATLPADEALLLPKLRLKVRMRDYLADVRPAYAERVNWHAGPGAEEALGLSCVTPLPFSWIGIDDRPHRDRLWLIPQRFETRFERRDGFLRIQVTARKPGACLKPERSAPPAGAPSR